MNIASIDIGTNTILLLIAKIDKQHKTLSPLLNLHRMPRIGKGLIAGREISEQKVVELVNVLSDYQNEIEKYNCEEVLLTATNAFRIASNSEKLTEMIKRKFGFEVRIVPGDEEAKLSFLGAISTINLTGDKVVIDIGGGSTEIIAGNETDIFFKKSFPVGAVSLTEKFLHSNPPADQEKDLLLSYLEEIFEELPQVVPPGLQAIAVAGTPTTLSCINQGLKDFIDEKVEGSTLGTGDLEKLIEAFSKLKSLKILRSYGNVVKGREDVILAGTILLNFILKKLTLDAVLVSGRGIRYGAVIDYMNKFTLSKESV